MNDIAVAETFISVDKPTFKWPWQDQAGEPNVRVLTRPKKGRKPLFFTLGAQQETPLPLPSRLT